MWDPLDSLGSGLDAHGKTGSACGVLATVGCLGLFRVFVLIAISTERLGGHSLCFLGTLTWYSSWRGRLLRCLSVSLEVAMIRVTKAYRSRDLTNRWSGRVKDKVPSSYAGVRAAQLNR